MQYAWFIWSLIILGIWLVIFFMRKGVRKEMLAVSLWTTPLGLTEPFFVPEYWDPPTLFNLAQKTGFDIESLIFSFAIGGIGSVLYNIFTKTQLQSVDDDEKVHRRHRFHRYTILVPVVVILLLAFFTNLNHIYCGAAGMLAGAISALWCRPDLKKKIWIGGILFTLLYFFYFTSLRFAYPNYVGMVWNMEEISGALVVGIPLEEYFFAFTFGMFWSSLYEHLRWYKLIKLGKDNFTHASL